MSDTAASVQHKIGTADELHSVVRTMKAMAASSIGQYQNAVAALDDYYRGVQLGLAVWLRQADSAGADTPSAMLPETGIDVIVFGSDLGMAGPFNDVMRDFVQTTLAALPAEKTIWAVGERIASQLSDAGLAPVQSLPLPSTIHAITPLVGRLLAALEQRHAQLTQTPVYVFHHRPTPAGLYAPVCQRLLPLDLAWRRELAQLHWPGNQLPEILGPALPALTAFLSEYLFVTLFRACAESQASENASRLAAMQRAEKNIEELLEQLTRDYHRMRQGDIDEELFELVAGFEALPPA